MSPIPQPRPQDVPSLAEAPGFVRYLVATAANMVAAGLVGFTFPVLAWTLSGSASVTAAVAALGVAPYLVFGLLAGAVADRVDRRRLMVGADVVAALAVLALVGAALTDTLTVPGLLVVAATTSTAFVWADCAQLGALPVMVGLDRVVAANGVVYAWRNVLTVVVPPLAGIAVAAVGTTPVVGVAALAYGLSALVLATIAAHHLTAPRQSPRDPATDPTDGGTSLVRALGRDIGDGLRFVWAHPVIRPLTLLGFGLSFTGGGVLGLLVVYAVDVAGVALRGLPIGALFATSAVGGVVGSLLVPWLGRRFDAARISLVAYSTNAFALLVVVAVTGFVPALLALTCWYVTFSLAIVNGIGTRARLTPLSMQSRVNAAGRMIAWGGQPFGAICAGVIAEAHGVRLALLLCGAGIGATVVLGWLSPLRHGIPDHAGSPAP